ncbi:hypothetical protein Tco_1435302 [Tanacetum coccineum]
MVECNTRSFNVLKARVGQELDVRLGDEVGYAIRFEDTTSERTRIVAAKAAEMDVVVKPSIPKQSHL